MPSLSRFHFLSHARVRMLERVVSEADVTSTVSDPHEKQQQRKGIRKGTVYIHSKKIGDRELCVVAEIVGKEAYVMTAYWNP